MNVINKTLIKAKQQHLLVCVSILAVICTLFVFAFRVNAGNRSTIKLNISSANSVTAGSTIVGSKISFSTQAVSPSPGHGSMTHIDNSKIPAPAGGYSKLAVNPNGGIGTGGQPGAFRTRCDYSHMNYDDPILYPGQAGKAHLHTFFGNTGANYTSSSQSLKQSGNSTCFGGIFNRSAYWVPTMVKPDGTPVAPKDRRNTANSDDIEIYYKASGSQGVNMDDAIAFPDGFQVVAGNLNSASGPTTRNDPQIGAKQDVGYVCEDSNFKAFLPGKYDIERSKGSPHIPNCPQGSILTMYVRFPQCWDGKNLASTDGRSHVAYGNWKAEGTAVSPGRGCPASHPYGFPEIELFVHYTVDDPAGSGKWRLSSDNYSNDIPGGYSGHADYIFAWDSSAFPSIVKNCYKARRDCGETLGDGRTLLRVRGLY
ncbi:DUF1996 domain-containing protein [Candidatus Saccharibacteria bacterium]|nr:DUF1996 domain-containing protein [Candidatus Saccharibacteria bacterium]